MAREIVPATDGVVALGSRVEIHDAGKRDVFQLGDAGLQPAAGPGDLDLVLRGAQRLSSFRIGTP